MNISSAYYDTQIGIIKYTYKEKIIKIELVEAVTSPNKKCHLTENINKQIEEYLTGVRKNFDIYDYCELSGTDFAMEVYKELEKIPYESTISYKEIARRIGNPGATRAVGTAIGNNPLMIIIPCHRVIKSDGSIGGYHYGLDVKRKLLALEGLTI